MYKGWLRFGAEEVINHERLSAYVDAGCRPEKGTVDVPVVCGGLGEVMEVSGQYVNPPADGAPWFNPEDPSTWWFGGVLALSVIGLEGSTYAGEVADRIGNGGVVTSTRVGPRTVAVSALLVGRDDASVHAGNEWLTKVLQRSCAPGDTCGGTTLEAFVTCPTPVSATEDPDAPFEDHEADPDDLWYAWGGRWEPATETFYTLPDAEPGETVIIRGGTSAAPGSVRVTGGTSATETWAVTYSGGSAAPVTKVGRLAGPELLGCREEHRVTWEVTPLDEGVRVAHGAVSPDGGALWRSAFTETGGDPLTIDYIFADVAWDEWRPALWVSEPGAVVALTVAYRPDLPMTECIEPYQRVFQDVVCITGPTIVAEHAFCEDATLLQVEWTWVANDGFRYQMPARLVEGLRTDGGGAAPYLAPGMTRSGITTVTAAETDCPDPGPVESCADDPSWPRFTAPPTAPRVPETGPPAPVSYTRNMIGVPAQVVPSAGTGVMRLTLVNDANVKRGIRVRMWPVEQPGFENSDCAATWETTIRYLEGGAIIVLDGPAKAVNVVCGDGSLASGSPQVRGMRGGPFKHMEVSCSGQYVIAIDVPAGQGYVEVDLSLSVREG